MYKSRLSRLIMLFSVLWLGAPEARAQDEYLDLGKFQRQLHSARSDHERARALLSVGFHFLLKPGERPNDLKAARAYCNAAERISVKMASDSLAAETLFLSSQIEKESGSRSAALATLNKAIARYHDAGDMIGQGKALMEKRHYYELSGIEMTQRIKIVTEALQFFEKGGDKRLQGDALLELGDVYGNDGKVFESIGFLKHAAQMYNQAHFPKTQYLYSTLSIAHTVLGSYQEGLKYGFQAEKVARALGDSSQTLCTIYNRIGMTYFYLGERNNALEFFRKGLAVALRNNDETGIVYLTGNIINKVLVNNPSLVKSMLPELDKIVTSGSRKIFKPITFSDICRTYLMVGNAQRAKFFMDKLFEFQKSKPLSPMEDIAVYRAAFEYYFYVKDFTTARSYLEKEVILATKSLQPRSLQAVYRSLYRLDSANGNYKSALENHKRFKVYTDSSAANIARSELQTLSVRYQLEKKNDEIKLKSDNIRLLTKDNDAQKSLIQRANTIRNITIAASILLILLLAALYSRWAANRKNSVIIGNKNQRLEQLVREKDWLVKEIHHRVKNNLQTIISLLETQAAYLQDEALSAVLDSQHRIHAMSLIHQKLYLVDNSTSIDMRTYVEELVHYLEDSFDTADKIVACLDVDSIQLEVSRAIPVGLIVNEAVTNAMKYAFPDSQAGQLSVSFTQLPDKIAELKIEDNGIGLPAGFDNMRPSSLGMRLMKGLAKEIGGQLFIESHKGTSVCLTFPMTESILHQTALAE